ncbi:hypothetical protein J2S47_004377 [Streptomyces griseoviridis]|uniref:Uncharacterized protein n=1 Tax=Streptomyces griseoviridis TaxID=45398 RepID=A0ABT9LJL2_STRGD|nr:hypothetical protein [Streptomyces griseoviridis]
MATGIRDLYVHAGPLEHDGSLPPARYPRARWLTGAVHRDLPGIRVHARFGDVLATEAPDGMWLDRAGTRAAVAASARQLLGRGFDGVRRDLEPARSGRSAGRWRRGPLTDGGYLVPLDGVRRVTGARDAVLSVAAHRIDPPRPAHGRRRPHRAPRVVVAGVLRAGRPARRPDRRHVVRHRPAAAGRLRRVRRPADLARPGGHPAHHRSAEGPALCHESDLSHRGHADTVPAAVRGVRLGLPRTDADRADSGVARTSTSPRPRRPAGPPRGPGQLSRRRLIFEPSQTSGSYLRSTARSFSGISALSVILMPSGQTSVQHLVMLQ